jgi:deferrochelatase/peroxidase EfeB
MATSVTSKHLMGTSELTLIAEIRPGLIPIAEPMTYATRLRQVLRVLFEIRKLGVERDGLVGGAGPLESLRTLHHIHWSIHDDDRKLLLAVSFDGPWEAYIRDIVERGGPILDVIFCHCSGYVGNSCFDGYPEFSAWVRARQINCDFFYAGTPNLTIDDQRYLQDFEQTFARLGHLPAPEKSEQNPTPVCPFQGAVPGLHVGAPTAKGPTDLLLARQRNLLVVRDRLALLFPSNEEQNSSNDELIFRRAIQLLGSFIDPRAVPLEAKPRLAPVALTESDVASIQGNILTGYRQVSRGRFLLVRLPEDPESRASALSHLAAIVTTEKTAAESEVTHNVAFTFSGLSNLGLSPELLSRFPKEFQEGMAARAGVLGDVGAHHPEKWELPEYRNDLGRGGVSGVERVDLSTVDVVVILQVPNEGDEKARELLDLAVAELEQREFVVLHEQPLERTLLPNQPLVREPFGFLDGFSQPVPQIENRPPGLERDRVPLGEILLGYENQRGESGAQPFELFKNSSFLVVRKLEQRVAAFEDAVKTGRTPEEAERVMALMMGRTRDGKPLVEPEAVTTNDFDYSQDQSGEKCPFFAHVRRANPRTTHTVYARAGAGDPDATHVQLRTPRIMRRGFGYRSGSELGVMFMAFNASIADQFEVIQRWVNGTNSTGVSSAHPDLIAGNFPHGSERGLSVRRGNGVETLRVPHEPFAKLKWGLYSFAPSKSGIEYLARVSRFAIGAAATGASTAELVTRGKQIASALAALEREKPGQSFVEWKRILEDNDLRPYARAVWAYVRSRGGSLKTTYGVLVGSETGVTEVLGNDSVYSVREYHRRMEATFGGHYLGMDRRPKPLPSAPEYPVEEGQYDRESVTANRWLMEIGIVDSFEHARALTRRYCNDQRAIARTARITSEERGEPVPRDPPRIRIDVQQLGRIVVSGVAEAVFGLPDNTSMTAGPDLAGGQSPARCPGDFQRVSQFIFHPNPSATLTEVAKARGAVVEHAVDDYVRAVQASEYDELPDWLTLPGATAARQAEHAKKVLVGAINGFAVPTSASFTSILVQWIESKELWRWQTWLGLSENVYLRDPSSRLDAGTLETSALLVAAEKAMMRAPVPDLLHRTAVERSLIGSEPVEPGDRVVISLASATAEGGKTALLFGGARDAALGPDRQKPLHACPGRAMAEGVLLGMLVGLLSEPSLRRADRITLEIEPEVPPQPDQMSGAELAF